MSPFGIKGDGQPFRLRRPLFRRLGAVDLTVGIVGHDGIVVMPFRLGELIDGDDTRVHYRVVEVEHRVGVGADLIVAAGQVSGSATVDGFLDGRVHKWERAVAAPVHNLQLMLLQDDACGREQLHVQDFAVRLGNACIVGHVGGIPDGLALVVGSIVEVQINTLLRTHP